MLQLLHFFNWAICLELANEPKHCTVQILAISEWSYLDIVLNSPAEKIQPPGFLDDIIRTSSWASHHEISVNHKGQVLYDPVTRLVLFKLIPFIWVQMLINIGHMEVFAEESAELSLGPYRIVANHNWRIRLLSLHERCKHSVYASKLYFIFSWPRKTQINGDHWLFRQSKPAPPILLTKNLWSVLLLL